LSPASAIALTLRAVGGLTTSEIARAFLVPEATMAQRISRAKRTIRESGVAFRLPSPADRPGTVRAVLRVLYLIFNEGYASSGGRELQRVDLTDEAIRLGTMLHDQLPDDPEVAGLLALMLLIDARRPARVDADGDVVPLADQDRGLWDRGRIARGTAMLDGAIGRGRVGEYQLQAAIAAVHDRAPRAEDTDWPQILALYGLLEQMTGSPVVTLNRAVAAGMADGPAAGLAILDRIDGARVGGQRFEAVRAHLLEMAGDIDGAIDHYRAAARLATNLAEQRSLTARAARLRGRSSSSRHR
jgi:predicted RNA polymerase sigma factor